jgi:hypothetical protein
MRSQLREHVSIAGYIAQCSMFIEAIHPVWLKAQVMPIMSLLFSMTTLWLTSQMSWYGGFNAVDIPEAVQWIFRIYTNCTRALT